jgi:hypothetical protein
MPILKMLSRSRLSSLKQSLAYAFRVNTDEELPTAYLHNLRCQANDLNSMHSEFLFNQSFREAREGMVFFYHTILSFSPESTPFLDDDKLEDIARTYQQLRGDVISVGVPHTDTDAYHIHFVASGNRYRSNRASGLRKAELHDLKTDLELYIQNTYPELHHSSIQHGKGEYSASHTDDILSRKGSSIKDEIKQKVESCLERSSSRSEFISALNTLGLTHYERTEGQLTGILSETGKKYRFKTLGFKAEDLALETQGEKTQEQQLLEELKQIQSRTYDENQLELGEE